MTQDLSEHAVPPNMSPRFHLMCTRCGRRRQAVRWSQRAKTNICHPNCNPEPDTES